MEKLKIMGNVSDIANQVTKDFMKRVGATPDKKYPSSGALVVNADGSVSWYIKGVKKTLSKDKVPPGVGQTIRQDAIKKEVKNAK